MTRGRRGPYPSPVKSVAGVTLALLVAFEAIASAQPAPAKHGPPAGGARQAADTKAADAKAADTRPPDDGKGKRSETAISDIASALAKALPAMDGRIIVGVAPLVTDVGAPRAKALSVTIAQVFAGKRGFEPPTEVETVDAVRGRARGTRVIVYLVPQIVNGELTVTANAFAVPKTVWARIRNPKPAPFAHAFAKAFIDAEVRSHLDPVPLSAFDATRGKNFESGVLALACDDVDRDGAPEIVTVSRRAVTLSRIRAGKVEPVKAHPWAELSSMHPAPLRESIAFAMVAHESAEPLAPGDVIASITDRASAIRFDARLEVSDKFPGIAVPDRDAYACTHLAALTVTGPLSACDALSFAPAHPSVGERYDAFASAKLVTPTGKPFAVFAGREDGVLEVFDDAGHKVTGPHVGAQLAVGDLDQDGSPEVLTSLDVPGGVTDAVVVYTWSRTTNKLKEVSRMPIAVGVRALAVCAPESVRHAPFLLATSDEIVVFR